MIEMHMAPGALRRLALISTQSELDARGWKPPTPSTRPLGETGAHRNRRHRLPGRFRRCRNKADPASPIPACRAAKRPHLNIMEDIMVQLSPLRLRLCDFDRAYACAIQRRGATGRNQYVIRTGSPIQPFRVTETRPAKDENLVLHVA